MVYAGGLTMSSDLRLIGLAAATFVLSSCATNSTLEPVVAETVGATLPPAVAPPAIAYVSDPELYAQLRVRISYEGQAANNLNLCPTEGFGVEDWKDILKGDRLTTAGFTVTTPDGVIVPVEPVTVRSQVDFFRIKCSTAVLEREYRSSLYALQMHAGAKFEVKTSTHQRIRPDDNITTLIGQVVQLVTATSGTTAPLAKPVADQARTILGGSGPDLTSTVGSDIFLTNPTLPEPYRGALTLRDRVIPVRVTVYLENRASIFNTARVLSPTAFVGLHPNRILQAPLAPSPGGGPAQTVDTYLMSKQSAAYTQVVNATTMATLQSGCFNLEQILRDAGLTNTDQSLVLWAMISKNSNLTAADRDQTKCLQDRKTYLEGVGIKLMDRIEDEPRPVARASTIGEMLVAVAPNGDSDNLVRFFKLNSNHGALADTLFSYPLALQDPDSVMMPANRRPVAHPDSWAAYAVARDRPFFTNFGCYAYGGAPAGEWPAKARVETPDGPRDYAVLLRFRTGAEGRALMQEVVLTPAATTPADFSCR